MKKHTFMVGENTFDVYVEELNQREGLIAIPKLKWSYLFMYDISKYKEYEAERDDMVHSLTRDTKMNYSDVEELIDRINESF
ncbi:YueH family protein [Bacillus anthracis]|uniref:YueH family protein n=1 Tax=Bacillus anthracis TaxID=1392 RepID=UPI002DBEE6E2|nr:YueH family protein [Bacillus anthracis]MEB9506420.1 YueH family protein [Bacillus anthracis]